MKLDLFTIPIILLLVTLYIVLKKRSSFYEKSRLSHSLANTFFKVKPSFKIRFSYFPNILIYLSLIFLVLAFIDPHTFVPRDSKDSVIKSDPTEGRILLFAVDQSGSMREKSSGNDTKLEQMKKEVDELIKKREGDLIGLMSFARTASVLSPPTLDHNAVLKELGNINPVPSPELDGTAIGYAIYKGANLINSLKEQSAALGKEAPYNVEGAAIIIVTDGLQDPNPLDKENRFRSIEVDQAAQFAKEKGVRLYIVNIEPKLASVKYLPNLKEMKRVAEMTGGAFYYSGTSTGAEAFLDKINELETSTIYQGKDADLFPTLFKRVSYAKEMLFIAIIFLFLGFILKETYFKKVTG